MKIAITGSHGLIGRALSTRLAADGDTVVHVVRAAPGPGEVSWDPVAGRLDGADLVGVDAVVHLAGAGLADRRWTTARRAELQSSRIAATDLLSRALAGVDGGPRALLSGSAIGYYGDRGDEELTEAAGPGTGFLAELCARWEAATAPAEEAGLRVVHLRTGIVLASSGGALARQLPLFRFGLGGKLGSGRQYMSWVSLEDEVGAITFALRTAALSGAVNLTAPEPVTNAEFTAALGRALHRPAKLAVPPFALRVALGADLVDEAILASQRVRPAVLADQGFVWSHPTVDAALQAAIS